MHTDEREQHGGADEARRTGTERIDVIEQSDRTADLSRALHQVRDKDGQGSAHQQGRNDNEQKIDSRQCRQRPIDHEVAYPLEDTQRHNAKSSRGYFDRRQ